ncbi:MAG: transcriptional antiterminator [Deltaproteobacteria bacterium]|nr:MAG: transcriptional antiterminator [Deltaproteobacteria bacterium]
MQTGGSASGWIERPEPAWYAVHTRSRHERRAREELQGVGLEVFLPEIWAWSRRRDRRRKYLKALFPGYLFVRTPLLAGSRLSILQARSVVGLVGVGYRPVPVPEQQVESVRLLVEGAPDAGPHPLVGRGSRVQVVDGPLAGVVGVVVEMPRGGRKIVVEVDLLGRAVAATLGAAQVAPFLG